MDDLSALLTSFAAAFAQDNRLFSLHFTAASLDAELLPHTLSGAEYISAPFEFSLECLCADIDLELKQMIGQGVDIAIHRNGADRVLSGIVTGAQQLGSNGGFARYGLRVEPAFAVLNLRHNSRVFQDKSVPQIVALLLDEHIQHNPVFALCFRHREQLTQTYPIRSYCQQYRESDFAFMTRLLREEGISYYFDFEHSADAIGLHTLVLFDAESVLHPALHDSIRFHRADATEDEDSITQWQAQRQIHSGSVSLASFDYKRVYTQHGNDTSAIDQGETGNGLTTSLDDYDPQSTYYGSDNRELDRYAQLRQQARDTQAKTFSGSGAVRGLGAGQWFALNDHPNHADDNEFVVLSQTLEARNNLPGEFNSHPAAAINPTLTLTEAGYRNAFEAVRTHIPIVPAYAHSEHAKPTARGAQTATVTGPAGPEGAIDEEIFTDASGRIKIQFHWARPQDHDRATHGASAANDDFSSCWVRVLMPSAGAGFGHQFLPRVGQEVLVDFIEGDIDRPVVVRVLHNGQHTPPTFENAGSLPANKTLSGIKTHEYKGNRHNEIVFDDTPNEIRTTLSTEHGKTQLNQGYLIHPRSESKGTPRGEGFELRTDKAGAMRAAQGLLITTEAQPNARGKQLDRNAAQSQLEAAQQLTQQLGDAASSQNANQPTPEPALNADPLNSKKPHILMHGHDGVALTTSHSTTIATGGDLNQISQRDARQTSGNRWLHNAGESISLFVANAQGKMKTAIKLLAAKGDILIQARSNDVEITADKNIQMTACRKTLTASASKEVLIAAGGGYIKFSGGNIEIAAPKTLSMKASSFSISGPVSKTGDVGRMSSAGGIGLASVTALPMSELLKIAETGATKRERRTARKAVIASARKSAEDMSPDRKAATLATADRFERNIDAVEKAKLCQNIYVKDKPDNKLSPDDLALKQQGVEGFKPLESAEDLKSFGLRPSDLSPQKTNFRAGLYEPDKSIFGEDAKPVLVFKGTENIEDWGNNFKQGLGMDSPYYSKANNIAKKLADENIDFDVAGHSLGGGLASSAAQISGMNATTFNSAGLHKNTVPTDALSADANPATKIQAYRLDGELLTHLQEDAFIVRKLMVPAIGNKIQILNNNPPTSRLEKHGMDHVIPAIEQQKIEDLHALSR